MDELFSNSGEKTQRLAKILTIVLWALFGIASIVFLTIDALEVWLRFLISIGCIIIGFLFGYLTGLFLYSYAVIVDRVDSGYWRVTASNRSNPTPAATPTPINTTNSSTLLKKPVVSHKTTSWICPKCGYANNGLDNECQNCYTKRPYNS